MEVFFRIADAEDVIPYHIKLDTNLCHEFSRNESLSELLVSLIDNMDRGNILYAPPRSVLAFMALMAGIEVHYDIYGDRRYSNNIKQLSISVIEGRIDDKQEISDH